MSVWWQPPADRPRVAGFSSMNTGFSSMNMGINEDGAFRLAFPHWLKALRLGGVELPSPMPTRARPCENRGTEKRRRHRVCRIQPDCRLAPSLPARAI